jgi:Na+/proline symporter
VWGTYLAGVLYLFFGIMSPLVGIMMFKLDPNLVNPDSVLVHAAITYVPPVLTALFMAALASALMSTSDSSLLAGASVVTQNLFPLFGKKLDPANEVKWTRIMVLINGIIGVVVALYAQVIYELGVVAWTLLLVGLFVPFAFGMYWKKANQWGGVASVVGGWGSWALLTWVAYKFGLGGDSTGLVCSGGDLSLLTAFSEEWWCGFWDAVYIASFPAFFISLFAMIGVSLATQKQDAPKPTTDVDGNVMDTNPFNYLGIINLKDALRKLRPEEYDQ